MAAAFAAADDSGDAIDIGVKALLWQLQKLKRLGFYRDEGKRRDIYIRTDGRSSLGK